VSADTRALTLRWGVEQTFAPVDRASGNAVATSVRRTLREEWVCLEDWVKAYHPRAAREAWSCSFNEAPPKQTLNWFTPAEY